nr:cohesin domain-containing protein [Acetivibrio clariflavus]
MNKEKDGIIRILFLDDTLLNEYISKDGVFANITI